MIKLKRQSKGNYYFENENGETIHIYKLLELNRWGYCVGHGMTIRTFKTLAEARNYFNY